MNRTTDTTKAPIKQVRKRRERHAIAASADDACLVDAETLQCSAAISRATLYDLITQGKAPQPDVRLGPRFVRWRVGTVRAWLRGLSAARAT